MPSQEILKIRDGTPLEAEGILTYIKRTSKLLEILKIRDGTPLEVISRNSKNSGWYPFGGGRNFDIHKKDLETAQFGTFLAISRNSKNSGWYPFGGGRNFDIHKKDLETARFGTFLAISRNSKNSGWYPFGGGRNFDIHKKDLETARSSQEILKIRDGTPLEAEGILTYIKRTSKLLSLALF
ncbi:hypothetical protein OROGR_015497 [Orobanche gracilis]